MTSLVHLASLQCLAPILEKINLLSRKTANNNLQASVKKKVDVIRPVPDVTLSTHTVRKMDENTEWLA